MPKSHTAASAFAAFTKLFKANPDAVNDALDSIDNSDIWNDRDIGMTPASVVTSTPQTASGSGLEKFIREYANPTEQGGIAGQYSDFARMLKQFQRLLISEGWTAPTDTAMNAASSQYVTAAKGKLRAAKASITKADIAGISADASAHADHIAKGRTALTEAAALLAKASEDMEQSAGEDDGKDDAGTSAAIEAAISELRRLQLKIDGTKPDDSMPGGRANRPDPDSMKGLSVNQLMNAVAGRGSSLSMPPDFAKAGAPVVPMSDKIEAALEAGRITPNEALEADTLLQHVGLVKAGRIPAAELHGILCKATPKVAELFGVQSEPARLSLVG